jgi:ribosome-binding factor A
MWCTVACRAAGGGIGGGRSGGWAAVRGSGRGINHGVATAALLRRCCASSTSSLHPWPARGGLGRSGDRGEGDTILRADTASMAAAVAVHPPGTGAGGGAADVLDDAGSGQSTRQRQVSAMIETQLRELMAAGHTARGGAGARGGGTRARQSGNHLRHLPAIDPDVVVAVELTHVSVSGDLSIATAWWRPAPTTAAPTTAAPTTAAPTIAPLAAPQGRRRKRRAGGRRRSRVSDEVAPGEQDERCLHAQQLQRGLERAARGLRHQLGRRLAMRRVPALLFKQWGSGGGSRRQQRRAERQALHEVFARIETESAPVPPPFPVLE